MSKPLPAWLPRLPVMRVREAIVIDGGVSYEAVRKQVRAIEGMTFRIETLPTGFRIERKA